MLFAASRPEIGAIMGIAQPQATGVVGGMMQERNKICLQSDPPQCFDVGDPFDTSLDTGSPYQTPSRKDFEEEMKPGDGGPPADFNIQDFLVPIKKAEVPETWNEGTGIEKGGYENAPQWLRDQLWKQDLRKRQELGLEPVVS